MQRHKILLFSCCLVLSHCFIIKAQDNLNINSILNNNSTPIKIKRKGISAIGKYEFDQYKLVSGKVGWTTTKNSTNFRGNSKFSSKNKTSFVFTNSEKDSVIANLETRAISEIVSDAIIDISIADVFSISAKNNFFNRTFFNWSGRTLTTGKETFVADFSFLKDDKTWNLIMISPLTVDVDNTIQTDINIDFKATLTDGIQEIEIIRIQDTQNNKLLSLRGPAQGYEFYLDGNAIAAIQYHYISMDKLLIWLHKDLDKDMRFVIATASTALLVKQYNN